MAANSWVIRPPLSLLHMASYFGIIPWVRALLPKKSRMPWFHKPADVNKRDEKGRTALSYACEKGYDGVVQLLLDGGADIKAKDNDGWIALEHACERGHEAVVQVLVDGGADVNAKSNGTTALLMAAKEGHKAVVRRLLDYGADVNATDEVPWTALRWPDFHGWSYGGYGIGIGYGGIRPWLGTRRWYGC